LTKFDKAVEAVLSCSFVKVKSNISCLHERITIDLV
jgi:hypothetical protein